jgi:hypothetical protein
MGCLVNLYGPVTTNLFVRGVIATPNMSVGPPLPFRTNDMFDHTTNTIPIINKNNDTIMRVGSDKGIEISKMLYFIEERRIIPYGIAIPNTPIPKA